MKHILITGANSYIGNSLQTHLSKWPNRYKVEVQDMIDGSWRNASFSGFDTVYHVAGIAHSDNGTISEERERLYRAVNTDLAVEVAEKAKRDGVRQFIFMSSAIVYGKSAPVGKAKVITKDTVPSPANSYGDSKLQAENKILPLSCDSFKVVVLRPPMVYGKGCRGNFPMLEKLALELPAFPYVKNSRSMLYVGNLVEFVRLVIENEESGIFWPCNREYSNTSELVQLIAHEHGRHVRLVRGFGWALKLLGHFTGLVDKAFGSLSYEEHLGDYPEEYRLYSLAESVRETES